MQLCAAAASAAVVQRVLLAECKTQGHRGRLSRPSRRHRGWHRPNPIRGGRGKGNLTTIALTADADGAAYHCPFSHINAFDAPLHCGVACNTVCKVCWLLMLSTLSTPLISCPLTYSLSSIATPSLNPTLTAFDCNPNHMFC